MEEKTDENTITIYEAIAWLNAKDKNSKIIESFLGLKAGAK